MGLLSDFCRERRTTAGRVDLGFMTTISDSRARNQTLRRMGRLTPVYRRRKCFEASISNPTTSCGTGRRVVCQQALRKPSDQTSSVDYGGTNEHAVHNCLGVFS